METAAEGRTGAGLVREAINAAETREEREVARQAAVEAANEIRAQLRRYWDTERPRGGFDPIAIAREHVIRELRAATIDAIIGPPPHVAHLSVEELEVFEKELELARKRAATIVRRSLRPPAPG